MRRMIALLLAVCLLAAGCGQDGPRASVPAGRGRTTIVFWNENAAADRTEYYHELIERFERENPDIQVQYVGLPKKVARLKINTAIATNELPDVCGVQSAWIAEFYNKGVLLNMDPYFEQWDSKDDLLPSVIADNRRLAPDGGLYQLPNTMGLEILWYRSDWFQQQGIDPPSDWESFFADVHKLTDKEHGIYGYTLRGGDGAGLQLMRTMFAYSGYTQFFSADGRCLINDPVHVAFAERYLSLYRQFTPTSDITNGYQEMVAAFDTGTAAMMQHNLGSYGSHKRALQPEQFAPLLLPRSRKGTIVQEANNVDGYSIFRTTKHPEAAWRFVRFLCSAEVQSWWNERIGQIPVSRQALDDDWVSRTPHMRLARQALESDAMRFYVPPMYLPEYRQIVDGSDRYLEQVLMGKLTVQEFLDQWAARFEKAERDYRRQQRETGQ
ncbi:ABC transporter substrate-binding protein [Selenomonas montiformis]|uniref:Sugar ABC transporter substrate-binding protein n=1 Tax=Selenomonas montiformis TaxID=2652285 RepID=A0A6I2UZG6_9FIRM|nr:sugar ABC transporter substrate-binding protein [Selenomonas montiformis]MSV25755.1 sugar ABC transporter substrate-binding protein [Selenomonas montiformis]